MLPSRASNMLLGALLLLLQCSVAIVDFGHFRDLYVESTSDPEDSDLEPTLECNSTSCYRYSNDRTAPYLIESWPDIDFDTGEMYAGSVPIDESDPERSLFFIFKPATEEPVDEVTIWLNGGPGCSSLFGFFAENGPFLWQPGTAVRDKKNRFAWNKMTNMLWVDQPVGTGFSQGKVRQVMDAGGAREFVGFFKNWEKLFGIKNYKIYLTGESYAGVYVPYIGIEMLAQQDKTYFDLAGALLYSPCIGDCGFVQNQLPTYPFVQANNLILNINQTFLEEMKRMSSDCGYTGYMDKYIQYPPPGHQPPPPDFSQPPYGPSDECNIAYFYSIAQQKVNPCFNSYHITETCPQLSNRNGRFTTLYLNREDVKAAIHAPVNASWVQCNSNVYVTNPDEDSIFASASTPSPILHVLPQIIEGTNRVLLSHGDWNGVVLANGSLLAIQNMTWNGELGFQTAPSEDFVVPIPRQESLFRGPQGVMGVQHYERGLQWVEVRQAGHELPMYQPKAAWRHLEWMLGRIDTL